MKVIDLLNKIANGEEALLIKYRDKILHWNKEKDRFEDKDGMNTLYEMDFSKLNDEVEIIEEDKKIKKVCECLTSTDNKEIQFLIDNINQLGNKVNEIIDYINEEKGE